MNYDITPETFESLTDYSADSKQLLNWNSIFILPVWLKVWWQELNPETELYLTAVRQDERIIGIAPLTINGGRASFIGSLDLCDYLDFIIVPGQERAFFDTLLDNLSRRGVSHLDLRSLRPDSTVLTSLVDIAQNRGYRVLCQPEAVSLELDLPSTWEEYLTTLDGKQRHELRRKLRKLAEEGEFGFRFIEDGEAIGKSVDTFLKMFSESRRDKAAFLTSQRESFFRTLAESTAQVGLARFGTLELAKLPVAMIMCFDYNDCIYLYNSGYNPQYASLSVGLLCKVLGIKESIEEGKKRFDFLKGAERYKYQLGGREVPLSQCQITIS